jgi:predicted Zn-dependent protease with MMP-like domain
MTAEVSAADFELLVQQALDDIPADLARNIENCVVLVEEFPPPEAPGLLGLYEGIPLTERGSTYGAVLPDRITIFRHPILARCETVEEAVREIHTTVVHEVAHHFGIDDERLDELGYG